MNGLGRRRPGRLELMLLGAAFGAVLVATLVTYARVPAADLYHVDRDGVAGGLSRALVELNFPIAILAVPVALIVADALGERPWDSIAAAAVAACLVTALPGAVDPDDLDAKALNVIPALGVVLRSPSSRKPGPCSAERRRASAATRSGSCSRSRS